MSGWAILNLALDCGDWPNWSECSKSFTGCFIPGASVCCIHWLWVCVGRIAGAVAMYRRLIGPPVRNRTTVSRTSNLHFTYYTRLSSKRKLVAFPTFAVASIFEKCKNSLRISFWVFGRIIWVTRRKMEGEKLRYYKRRILSAMYSKTLQTDSFFDVLYQPLANCNTFVTHPVTKRGTYVHVL
jgi:hypothetical protein